MFEMIAENLSTIIPFVTAVFGGFGTYLITRVNVKKDLTINDRMQLSKDQYQLIAELREMMQEQREEMEGMREDMRRLQAVNVNLTLENKSLQGKIAKLTIENKTLQSKIHELNIRLDSMRRNK